MFAETRKEVLVEYPFDTVYNTLFSIFPIKYYKLRGYDKSTRTFTVLDSFNRDFIMEITLTENTPNTTVLSFRANYPEALMDLTEGGKQTIEMVLEELLNQLNKYEKSGTGEAQNSNIEVVNADNFINTTKNKTHHLTIGVGYILCILSIIFPLIAIINYDPDDFVMFTFLMIGILSLAIEISVSVILQYYEDSKSILHGRIQLCICGFSFIILGILIHPSLAVAGILIPLISLRYLLKREKSVK